MTKKEIEKRIEEIKKELGYLSFFPVKIVEELIGMLEECIAHKEEDNDQEDAHRI